MVLKCIRVFIVIEIQLAMWFWYELFCLNISFLSR